MTRLRVAFWRGGRGCGGHKFQVQNVQSHIREESLFAPQAENGGLFNDLALSSNVVRLVRVNRGFPKILNLRLREAALGPPWFEIVSRRAAKQRYELKD
jgi:hypothetical protein